MLENNKGDGVSGFLAILISLAAVIAIGVALFVPMTNNMFEAGNKVLEEQSSIIDAM